MRKYRLISKKGEGTFSEVLKAQSIKNGNCYAIKCMKTHFHSLEQVNNLREIQALRRLSPHPNIIKLEEVLYDKPTGRLALVFELMDMNLYELIRGRRHYLDPQLVKIYAWQLLRSIAHMHDKGVFHRDLKPENILIENNYDVYTGLKLADFGSCRGMYSKQPYTEYISTRWYRAPECLLTDGYYGPEMDVWGVGCVLFEISALYPLFPGTNELDQIRRIHSVLGTPDEKFLARYRSRASAHIDFNFGHQEGSGIRRLVPHLTEDCVNMLVGLLTYDPATRLSARQALSMPYFDDLRKEPEPDWVRTPQYDPTGSKRRHRDGGKDRSDKVASTGTAKTLSPRDVAIAADGAAAKASSSKRKTKKAESVPKARKKPAPAADEVAEEIPGDSKDDYADDDFEDDEEAKSSLPTVARGAAANPSKNYSTKAHQSDSKSSRAPAKQHPKHGKAPPHSPTTLSGSFAPKQPRTGQVVAPTSVEAATSRTHKSHRRRAKDRSNRKDGRVVPMNSSAVSLGGGRGRASGDGLPQLGGSKTRRQHDSTASNLPSISATGSTIGSHGAGSTTQSKHSYETSRLHKSDSSSKFGGAGATGSSLPSVGSGRGLYYKSSKHHKTSGIATGSKYNSKSRISYERRVYGGGAGDSGAGSSGYGASGAGRGQGAYRRQARAGAGVARSQYSAYFSDVGGKKSGNYGASRLR